MAPPTTLAVPVVTTSTLGYVVTVFDGRSFDLQTSGGVRRWTLDHIEVPDIGTCEGVEARALLAALIAGKQVRIDGDGVVWIEDLDVARTLVLYGRARAGQDLAYVSEDMGSVDFDCAATTTTTIRVVVVTRPKPKTTKPKATTPKVTTPVETDAPVTEPAEPVTTPAPRETSPPGTE